MKVKTLQNHYSMNIIKYKVKYILYLKIFYRERKRGCLLLFWGIFSSHPEGTFDVILMDIMMPLMDGFEVLAVMNKYHMISDIPVIMISAESASSYVERAYEMGVTDYISRPFNALVVQKRVENTLMLYAKQKRLVHMVADQI